MIDEEIDFDLDIIEVLEDNEEEAKTVIMRMQPPAREWRLNSRLRSVVYSLFVVTIFAISFAVGLVASAAWGLSW